MVDPKIKLLLGSPLTSRQAVLSTRRESRGGLSEAISRTLEEMKYFDIMPQPCDVKTYEGLRYVGYVEPKFCVFVPGKEIYTTREYARVNSSGEILVHPDFIFPGQNGWIDKPWSQRVVDNMFPMADMVDFFTGEVYRNQRENDGLVETMDARGKDYILLLSPHHIVPAHSIDFARVTHLEKVFAERELTNHDILYVVVGSNNPGLPQKVTSDFLKGIGLESLVEYIQSRNGQVPDDARRAIAELQKLSQGYYESIGKLSGASQLHPHGRVISIPILPKWIEEGYKRTEEYTSRNGKTTFHDSLLEHGLLIAEGNNFILAADPVPEYNGGLIIIANSRQNIVEMNPDELNELGMMRKLGRVMLEILYGGLPSNDYMIQTFGDDRITYPHTRFSLSLVPRANVQAVLELGTKIVGLSTDPKLLAETMRNLQSRIPEYLRFPTYAKR